MEIRNSNLLRRDEKLYQEWIAWRGISQGLAHTLTKFNVVAVEQAGFILDLKKQAVMHLGRNSYLEQCIKSKNYLSMYREFRSPIYDEKRGKHILKERSGKVIILIDEAFIGILKKQMLLPATKKWEK